jgi:TolB-like protein/tetratricopeptide (TPR) repeat protein/predicted Ser/Thr protein kinase
MPLAPGTRLGSYEILTQIGAGGMGEVWKARDTRLDHIVAIKQLKAEHTERFKREARAIAALNHPHICQLYDVGPDYLVMEYVDGTRLKCPLPPEEAVRLAVQIAAALEEAHSRGIVHRDVKPGNILVTAKGAAKLLDFGLAKLEEHAPRGDAFSTLTTGLTEAGAVVGTVAYMSPEQAQGQPVDARSDIFSFGSVMYEVLSGRRAFAGDTAFATMSSIVRDEPSVLQAPAGLVRLVRQCLAKHPEGRFQTMTQVRAALEQISATPMEQRPSIAVLPFANMSRDVDDEYFSDGLAEEIINALTQVRGLKVIARTSAFAFKGKNEDIREIAEAPGVTSVLEGSVRRAGSRLRVTAQLIHAADGTHLWSQRYDRELTDVFAVQDEIAAAIVRVLRVKLTGKLARARPHQPNLPAYEAFLKGRHLFYTLAPGVISRAEEYFKQAIGLDPQWSDPHSALARQYFRLGALDLCPLSEMMPLARSEALKALELLPSEPTARAVLGAIAGSYEYEWEEAGQQFRLALATEPLPPEVHDLYAVYYLLPLGRFKETIEQQAKANAHDPLNVLWRSNQFLSLLGAEMYERAILEARKVLEFDDRNYVAQFVIASGLFFQGKLAEAREPAEDAFRLAPWHAGVVGLLAGLLAQTNERDRAEKLIATMRGMIPFGMITYHLVQSEIDAAIDWYERLIEQRQPIAAELASAGYLKPLRSNPRWPKLAKMMNLPG